MSDDSQVSRVKQHFQQVLNSLCPSLKNQALTHVSYANEKCREVESNERLEFLGDAVLSLVVGLDLYNKYPQKSEGDLTRMRAYLVSGNYLAALAEKLDLGSYLFLGKGEESTGGRHRSRVLAGALEAVIGACFLECGWEEVKRFICALFEGNKMDKVPVDPKTRLQELVQSKSGLKLEYVVMSVSGLAHQPHYDVGCFINNKEISRGFGSSKREAEENAASNALLADGFSENKD